MLLLPYYPSIEPVESIPDLYIHVHVILMHTYMYILTSLHMYIHIHILSLSLPPPSLSPPLHDILATHSDVPTVKFKETRSRLKFLSLTSSVEALSVLEVVRVECGKVGEMRLFHTGASKPLRLEEYDQAQQQATSHVYMYSNIPYVV